MTATQHTPAASRDESIAFGGYIRESADHTVVAVRQRGGRWRLIDITSETATVIESFFPDEGPGAVQAVAELYLTEMHT